MALWAVLLAFLLSLGLFMVTEADVGQRILARSIPQMTGLDGLLALHLTELQARAQADPRTPVSMAEFPVQVSLPAGQVARAGPDRIATLISQRAAAEIYQMGPGAFALNGLPTRNQTGPFLSSQWAVHQTLGLLNARAHGRFARLLLLFGCASLLLAMLYCLRRPEGGRLTAVSTIGAAAAFTAVLISLLAWAGVNISRGVTSGPLGSAAWHMAGDTAWVLALVTLVAFAGFAATALTSYAFLRLDEQRQRDVDGNAPAGRPALEVIPRGTRPLDRLPKPPPPPSN
jgi:hypothetical protein